MQLQMMFTNVRIKRKCNFAELDTILIQKQKNTFKRNMLRCESSKILSLKDSL